MGQEALDDAANALVVVAVVALAWQVVVKRPLMTAVVYSDQIVVVTAAEQFVFEVAAAARRM